MNEICLGAKQNQMKRLALDSSLRPTSIALQQDDDIIVKTLAEEHSGAENLVSEIAELMKSANLNFDELDEIIVANGPGPFIGLRVGLAAALGVSLAAGVPIKSIPTFAVLASFIENKEDEIIIAAQPARKGFVSFQQFNKNGAALTALCCVSESEFEKFCEAQKNSTKNITFAPTTPPSTLSEQLLKCAALAVAGAAPIYPPEIT